MHTQEFKDLMKKGLAQLVARLDRDMPLIAPQFQTWMKDLAGSHEPADYFLHPVAFPLMSLPWWLERQLRSDYDPAFQLDLIQANASMYYYVRLVDNVMDGHATVEPKLLPAAGYFVNRFHGSFHPYFQQDHLFWDFFDATWSNFCDVTAADGQLADVDEETFLSLVARKVSAAKISVAAVCHRCDRPDLIPAWGEWIDAFGAWHLFREDLFDWQQDLQLGAVTYLLAEAGRRKRPGEGEAMWMAREGVAWALARLDGWMERLRRFVFVSTEVSDYLEAREQEVRERAARLKPAFDFIRRLSESAGYD
jgi:hypothetical protein